MSENIRNRKKFTLDSKDYVLIEHLQANARITNAELGDVVGLSPSGVQKRLKKLEESGVIKQYTALIDRKALNFDMLVFVQVSLKVHATSEVKDFDEAVADLAEVLECHRMTGSADYLMKLVVRDTDHLDNFLMNTLMTIPAVDRVHSNLVLKAIKETTHIK